MQLVFIQQHHLCVSSMVMLHSRGLSLPGVIFIHQARRACMETPASSPACMEALAALAIDPKGRVTFLSEDWCCQDMLVRQPALGRQGRRMWKEQAIALGTYGIAIREGQQPTHSLKREQRPS